MKMSSRILGGTLALSSATVVTRVASFFSVLLITRSMSLHDFGAMQLALTVTGPIGFLTSFGVETAMVAELARRLGEGAPGSARKLFRSFARQKIGLTILLLVIGWFGRTHMTEWLGEYVADYFLWIAVLATTYAVGSTMEALLQATERFLYLSWSVIVESLLRLLFLVIILWGQGGLTPTTAIGISALAKASALLLVELPEVVRQYRRWASSPLTGGGMAQLLWTHGKWGVVSQGILPQIDNALRPWMVNFFFGTAAVALTTFPGHLFGALTVLFPIHKVIAPRIARTIHDPVRAADIARRATKLGVWSAVLLAITSSLAVVPFVRWFFPAYEASIIFYWVIAPRLIVLAIGAEQDAFFQALRVQKSLVKYQIIVVLSNVTLLPIALRVFGLAGLFAERTVAVGVVTVLREQYLRRVHGVATIGFRDLFHFSADDRALLGDVIRSIRHKVYPVGEKPVD